MSLKMFNKNIAVIGGGNIGMAIAKGILKGNLHSKDQITITRKEEDLPKKEEDKIAHFQSNNRTAAENAKILILAVRPTQLVAVLEEIKPSLIKDEHIIISIVSGFSVRDIEEVIGQGFEILRAMPNTAIAIGESMTCIASETASNETMQNAMKLFNSAGRCLIIEENQMLSATALCSCGVAFFLRSIRAASQGGIQSGFHAEESLIMAAQTAKGAAELLLVNGTHPESEIDKVTTPRGCTIAGLNEMEFQGFSSAMIKGILTAQKVSH